MKKIILSVIYILLFQNTFSDFIEARPGCYKPSKPYEFNSQSELDSYREDVEEYQECIINFIEKQQNEAKIHTEAANNAIEEWNNFVRWDS
ncbi:MAG: hypothetical protein ACRC6U_04375 [Fusobacteriaceae bacterium]